LKRWSRDWLEQAGVNTMAARYALADGAAAGRGRPPIARFTVEQSAAAEQPTLRPHRIAIGLYDRAPGELRLRRRFETDVEGAETRIPDLEGESEPDLILLNDQDLTYAKIRLDPRSRDTIEDALATLPDPLARVLIWNAVWDEVRDAVTPASRYVDLVLGGIHGESDPGVMRSLLGNLAAAIALYRVPEARAADRQRVASAALGVLEKAAPGSDEQLIWAKAFVSAARIPEHVGRLRDWLGGAHLVPGLAVDRELRWQIIIALAGLGHLEEDVIAAELAREASDWAQRQAAAARAARPTAAAKAAAWTAIAETPATPLATMRALMSGFMRLDQEAVITPYVERYFAALRPLWAARDPELVIAFAGAMYPSVLIQPEILDRTAAELAKGELAPPIRRRLLEQQDQVARALRAQAADRKEKEAAPCSVR
jgi:aminopeptidase N